MLFFAAGQAGFRCLLHWRPQFADREYGRKLAALRELRARHPDRPLVLMLGSSRVATGFRPEALPALATAAGREPIVFNFAQTGSGPVMTLLCLKRLLAAGVRPDWVLVECWPAQWYHEYTADDYLIHPDLIHLSCLGWSALRLLGRYSAHPEEVYRRWCAAQVAALVQDRRALLHQFAPYCLAPSARLEDYPVAALGWRPVPAPDAARHRGLAEYYRALYGPCLRQLQVAGISDYALRETVGLCRAWGIRAAVVVLPEGSEFRCLYPAAAADEVPAYLDRLQRELRVPVIDARTWVADDGFLDGHHLATPGATAFTRRLGEEVLRPLLAGPSE